MNGRRRFRVPKLSAREEGDQRLTAVQRPTFCRATQILVVSVMLASFQLLAQAQGKERPVEHPTFYRTIQIDGLSIFYREAGPKDAPTLLLLRRGRNDRCGELLVGPGPVEVHVCTLKNAGGTLGARLGEPCAGRNR